MAEKKSTGAEGSLERKNTYRKRRKAEKKEKRRETRAQRAAYTAEELEADQPVDTNALLREEKRRRAEDIAGKMRRGDALTSVERKYAQDHASEISKAFQNPH